jgi:hypothetical protein
MHAKALPGLGDAVRDPSAHQEQSSENIDAQQGDVQ